MERRICMLLAGLLLLATSGTVEAHWFDNWWTSFSKGYHRSKCWPQPFVQPDRRDVYGPFAVMEFNGWRQQNMLGDHHFSPETGELTQAGRRKAYWVLTQNPPHRRTLFVQRGATRKSTVARLRSINHLAGQILPPGMEADVRETHLAFDGHPADIVDRTNVQFIESLPAPALPASTFDSGGQ